MDAEIAQIAGPQLVVPVMNARFSLNAANARWGSLYDALYGTDIISEEDGAENVGGYNEIRGEKVISFAKKFLDESIPLANGKFKDVIKFEFINSELLLTLKDKSKTGLGLGLFIGKTLLEKNFASVICRNSKTRSGAEVIIKWRNKELFNIQ